MMSETKTCPKCGSQLPENAPAGICPTCLMQAGLASDGDLGSNPEMKPTTLASGFTPPEPEDIAKHFPQLEIIKLLGKGGMGAVYKARQPGLDRLVALKILPPDVGADSAFAERFTREARALARLTHNHIVSVYDFGQADGLFYILMEYVDGVNLRQAIQPGGLSPADALAIVPQVCEALQFAHDEGIVHRDIKPENILIDTKGRVKIADFGLAKLLGNDAADQSLTGTHQVMGTLRYMAPEQLQGSREVDHRADIYSLGVVFYELLTGELPMGRFAPPSKKVQVDVRLDEIVLRALEQEPEQRYQHASDVKTDVELVSCESRGPNLPVQQAALPDEAQAEPASLPFTISGAVHWGLIGEVHGKLRLGRTEIVVEFEVRSMVPAFRSRLKEVSIPFDEIESVNWDGWDLTLRTKSMRTLAEIPHSSQGQVAFDMAMIEYEVPDGISKPVERFLACLPSRLAGKSATVPPPKPAKLAIADSRLVQAPADCLLLAAGIAFVTACGVAIWLLAVPAYSSNQYSNSMIRGNLIGMSAGLAIYSVFISIAGLLLRRLRARLVVLLIAGIVGLFFPAVAALNVVMELRNIPQWPVVIPLWLGVPVALWVVVTLFRADVRRAFDEVRAAAQLTGEPRRHQP